MIRFFLVAIAIWMSAAAGQAQVLTFRNGEHSDFTRLVLTIPDGADWSVDQVEDQVAVTVAGVTEAATDGFFARISRNRISDISRGGEGSGDITLTLACRCRAVPFLWRPDRLVIDIRDGPPPAPPEVRPEPAAAQFELPIISERHPAGMPRLAFEMDSFERLQQVQDQLSAVSPSSQNPPPPAKDAATIFDAGLPDVPGITIRTEAEIGSQDQNHAELQCPQDAYYAVADWGAEDQPFHDQIASARRDIALEMERNDSDAVLELARRYLYFGFGKEAADTLSIDGALSAERAVVRRLAAIMDDDGVEGIPLEYAACEGPVAIWAVLSQPEDAILGEIDAGAIARRFKELPLHLQSHLGPRLAIRIGTAGQLDAAETVLSVAQRPNQRPTEGATVAAARLDTALDRPRDAAKRLSQFVATEPDVTPQTLIDLTSLQIAQNLPVPIEQIELIDTVIYEWSTPVPALESIRVRALAHRGDVAEAASSLDRASQEDRDALLDIVLAAAVAEADDVTFLDLAFSPLPDLAGSDIQNRVSQRLIALGFGERATAILKQDASRDVMAERRYLRAQAAVLTGDILMTERHLSGITTTRAADILNRARYGPGVENSESLAAWRAGNWAGLATSDDGPLQSASTSLLTAPSAVDIASTPLRDSESLLTESATTRETVATLLGRFPFEVEEN